MRVWLPVGCGAPNGVIYVFVEVPEEELPVLVNNLKQRSMAMQRELARQG